MINGMVCLIITLLVLLGNHGFLSSFIPVKTNSLNRKIKED
jgi:hypothetical protein